MGEIKDRPNWFIKEVCNTLPEKIRAFKDRFISFIPASTPKSDHQLRLIIRRSGFGSMLKLQGPHVGKKTVILSKMGKPTKISEDDVPWWSSFAPDADEKEIIKSGSMLQQEFNILTVLILKTKLLECTRRPKKPCHSFTTH